VVCVGGVEGGAVRCGGAVSGGLLRLREAEERAVGQQEDQAQAVE